MEIMRSEALVILEFSSRRGIPRPGQGLTNSRLTLPYDDLSLYP